MVDRSRFAGLLAACSVLIGAVSACGSDGETNGGAATAATSGAGGATSAGSGGGGGASSTATSTSTATGAGDPCAGVIDGFATEWKPSTGLHQGLCDATQVDGYFLECIQGNSKAECDAFVAANAACVACLMSAADDPAYGPMTYYDVELIYENPGQCVSVIEGDTTSASCGAKVFAVIQCSIAACSECKGQSFDVLLQCLSSAEAGSCKPLVAPRDACVADLEAEGVPIEPCLFAGGDFQAYLKSLSILGCGS